MSIRPTAKLWLNKNMSEGPFYKKLSGQISGEEKLTRNNDVNCMPIDWNFI